MKKFVLLMIVGALALSSFAACGKEADDTQSKPDSTASEVVSTDSKAEASTDASAEVSTDANTAVDLPTLRDELKGKTTATELLDKTADDLFNDTGIADSTYANFFWFSEMSGLSSETVAVFEAKTDADAATIKGFLEGYVQSVCNQMKDYNAENYDMATKAVIKTAGSYVYLVMSPNVADIDTAIAAALA